MKETSVLLGGFGFMTLAVVVLANFGHVGFAFFSQDPRWWSLPLSIAAAVVALAGGRQSRTFSPSALVLALICRNGTQVAEVREEVEQRVLG